MPSNLSRGLGRAVALAGLVFAPIVVIAPSANAISAPSNLSPGGDVSSNTPKLSWGRPSGAAKFEVQVDNDPGFGSPELNIATTNTRYVPKVLLRSGPQSWRVRALTSGGTESRGEPVLHDRSGLLADPAVPGGRRRAGPAERPAAADLERHPGRRFLPGRGGHRGRLPRPHVQDVLHPDHLARGARPAVGARVLLARHRGEGHRHLVPAHLAGELPGHAARAGRAPQSRGQSDHAGRGCRPRSTGTRSRARSTTSCAWRRTPTSTPASTTRSRCPRSTAPATPPR